MKIDFNSKEYKIIYIICLIILFVTDLGNGYFEVIILLLLIFDKDIYKFVKNKLSKRKL